MKLSLFFIVCFITYNCAFGQTNKREDILKVTVDDYSLSIPGINKIVVASNQLLQLRKETMVIIDDKIYDSSNFKYLNIDTTHYRLIKLIKDSTSKSQYKEVYIYKSGY